MMEFTTDPGPQWPHITILFGFICFCFAVFGAITFYIEVLIRGRRALWEEYKEEDDPADNGEEKP